MFFLSQSAIDMVFKQLVFVFLKYMLTFSFCIMGLIPNSNYSYVISFLSICKNWQEFLIEAFKLMVLV